MFAPPEDIATEVFAELPDELRLTGRHSDWNEGQPGAHPGHSLLEGPAFARDGAFYCVDIAHGRVFTVGSDGTFKVIADYDGEPNGLKIHQDGRIFIADYKHGILTLDPTTGEVAPVVERVRMERLKAVNDLVFASNGDLYFTDQGLTGWHDPSGRVFRLRADGRIDCLLTGVPSPNGLVLSLDEQTLFVAVTRANAVWRVPLMRDGSVAKVGTFIQLSGGNGPDGLALDQAGNLVVAHAGLGSVWVFSPVGEPLYRVRSCRGTLTTNVAYGGPDYRTLYITEAASGSILSARLPVPGRPLFSHL